jgi:peptidoglycan/xylan/chitin deacetylase (PgdA/CDA1 family)
MTAFAGTMLVGYDVEWWGDDDVTPRFLRRAREIHRELGIPATLFIVGRTLERWPHAFDDIAGDPLFDLQQHTYSHQLLKTVYIDKGHEIQVERGVGLEEIRREVRRTTALLHQHLGVECTGLTGPWGYYRGLRDRPDILQVLWEEGIRFTRTDGRNEKDWHPVELDLQPYWYEPLGFPEMLEIPIHGWHDSTIRAEVLSWDDLDGYVRSVTPYIDRAADEGLVLSFLQHDWTSICEDPRMRATEDLLLRARRRGLQFQTYYDYYRQALAERQRAPAGMERHV